MADTSWRERIERGRTILQNRTGDLSAGARAAAEGAGARIGSVYGQARGQVGGVSAATRERAGEFGSEALRRGRDTLDKAAIASRGLIAERPLTAVIVGIGAGLVLGALANRLGRARAPEPDANPSEEDEWYQ